MINTGNDIHCAHKVEVPGILHKLNISFKLKNTTDFAIIHSEIFKKLYN